MGAGNKARHINQDRHEYNNNIKGIKIDNNSGLSIILNLLIIAIGACLYGLYRALIYLYNKHKNKKDLEQEQEPKLHIDKQSKMTEYQDEQNVGYA